MFLCNQTKGLRVFDRIQS
uniref:Uncharacterized protein n=1 Tax=Arundo donax TaxID=35708 RepID=A0A0A8YLN1_ARUDO